MLRRSEETMSTVDVGDDSPLIGNSIGSIDAAIIAVGGPDGDVVTIPERDRVIQRGDTLFAIGRPDTLRKLDSMKGTQLRETPERLQQAAMDAVRWEADD